MADRLKSVYGQAIEVLTAFIDKQEDFFVEDPHSSNFDPYEKGYWEYDQKKDVHEQAGPFAYSSEIIGCCHEMIKLGTRLDGEFGTEKSRTAKSSKPAEKEQGIKPEFIIEDSRLLYNGEDLNLPTGEVVSLAKKLIENIDKVVSYKELDEYSTAKEASDNLRKYKSIFQGKLKALEIPYKITTKRSHGYILSRSQTIHKQSR